MQKYLIITLTLVPAAVHAAEKREENKRDSSPSSQTQTSQSCSALLLLLESMRKEIQKTKSSGDQLFPPVKKDEAITLLETGKAAIVPLAQDQETRDFLFACNKLALEALKLAPKFREFALAGYANHKQAQVFIELLFIMNAPPAAQQNLVKDMLSSMQPAQKPAPKKKSRCVIL